MKTITVGETAPLFTLLDENNTVNEGDLFASFVGDELRGVGSLSLVPDVFPVFGEWAGQYQFAILIYSNEASGETITFKYYDSETDAVYDIADTYEFISDMAEGDAIDPVLFNFESANATTDAYESCVECDEGLTDVNGIPIDEFIEEDIPEKYKGLEIIQVDPLRPLTIIKKETYYGKKGADKIFSEYEDVNIAIIRTPHETDWMISVMKYLNDCDQNFPDSVQQAFLSQSTKNVFSLCQTGPSSKRLN